MIPPNGSEMNEQLARFARAKRAQRRRQFDNMKLQIMQVENQKVC
jgi:hypothetical protein